MNYYNEFDPFAAAWLRELIRAGHIAKGEVDERSIEDVVPGDLKGFRQCHFFAGIGVWSYALRRAGWSDDREVWTGSCPCQPFSAAGKRAGVADERHLWPAFYHLIGERKPAIVFGEQVASKDGLAWLDVVQADLEGAGYACGAADICAAGFGAPHIRQRLYFVANNNNTGSQRWGIGGHSSVERTSGPGCVVSVVANPTGERLFGRGQRDGSTPSLQAAIGCNERSKAQESCLTSGFWAGAEWIDCLDGRKRAVEPGTFPLAHGAANRVGRLRGYGNALCAPVAQAFIESVMESLGG